MRAKLKITSITQNEGYDQLTFAAVSSDKFGSSGESEDNTFARYTPTACLQMTITNPELIGVFKPGQKFYVDFTDTE